MNDRIRFTLHSRETFLSSEQWWEKYYNHPDIFSRNSARRGVLKGGYSGPSGGPSPWSSGGSRDPLGRSKPTPRRVSLVGLGAVRVVPGALEVPGTP